MANTHLDGGGPPPPPSAPPVPEGGVDLKQIIIHLKAGAKTLDQIQTKINQISGKDVSARTGASEIIGHLRSAGIQFAITTDANGNVLYQITA